MSEIHYFPANFLKESKSCNDICPSLHTPVCGSDGIEYGSKCQLDAESCRSKIVILVTNDGPCCKEGACEDSNCQECNNESEYNHVDFEIIFEHDYDDFIYFNKSVCGDDGKTYGSMCELDRANCLNQKGTFTYKYFISISH